MRQQVSCAETPAANRAEASWSSAENKPLCTPPRATTQAPVSVAMSTTAAGLNRSAYVKASQRTRRPSASVLSTSMVWPLMLVTTSPGFTAPPSAMFSQAGIRPTTFTAGCSSAKARNTPSTLAAPHMSNFISSISAAGLMDTPPVSKVIPLPTSTWGACVLAAPV